MKHPTLPKHPTATAARPQRRDALAAFRKIIRLGWAIAALPALIHAQAATLEDYQPLLENSPFLSLAFKERLAKSESAGINQYTFNGYTELDGEWRLCLIRKSDGIAFWVGIGETVETYTVGEFDPEKHTLILEKGGIKATIPLDIPK